MKCEKRKKNGIGYSRDICFNCSSLYCFRIITKSKINSYSCITSGMLSISNLDYLAMSKLSLLWTNLMSPFSKYSFNSCLILQVKIYINIFFLKDRKWNRSTSNIIYTFIFSKLKIKTCIEGPFRKL